jgi:hypothetical protein
MIVVACCEDLVNLLMRFGQALFVFVEEEAGTFSLMRKFLCLRQCRQRGRDTVDGGITA